MTTQSENPRFCFCPAQVKGNCTCGRVDCKCFNGFKRLRVIMASAGTGKTFQLAMRFIQLLRFGVDPAEILAVTFTKKAAGEIFDKIIGRLLELADPAGKKDAGNTCEMFSRSQFLDILRRLLEMRRELQIGTIDSFFRKLTDVYAPELGIWGGISLIDAKDRSYRRRTLRKWLRLIGDGDELAALRELLKMANRDEQKSFSATMDDLVDSCYPFFLAHENEHLKWGNIPFLFCSDQEELPRDVVTDISDRLDGAMIVIQESDEKYNKVAVRRIRTLADFCAAGAETIGRLPDDVKSLFENLVKYNPQGWENDDGKELLPAAKWTLAENIGDLVRQLFRHIRAVLTQQARTRAQAVYWLMENYNKVYHREVRAAGLLTFADIPYLLQSGSGESDFRLFFNESVNLEERLDARLNHYLFDEFQDTSDIQWNAFDNLLDELVNDRESDFRTFFCVGDIKQSIYRFRQGNPRLFGRVIDKMKTQADTLTLSRRSAPQVMELVNAVFHKPLKRIGFLESVSRLEFEEHKAYHQDMPGFAALIQFEKADRPVVQNKAEFILAALCDVRPFDRKLSVGVLMRNNQHLREFGQVLQELIREKNLPFTVSVDGTLSVLESVAVEMFLQLLTLSSHPADKSAHTFLRFAQWGMERLSWKKWGSSLRLGETCDADALSQALRHLVNADGIVGLADRFLAGFGEFFSDFDRRRFEALREMAEDFSGAPDDFREQLQWQQDEEKSLAGSIQLMTIHKSKGLEFDLVFLPEFDSRHGGANIVPEIDIPDVRQSDAKPAWIGYLPDKAIASTLPGAAEYFAAREEEEEYDIGCTVYVALTRAKRALYLLFATPGKDSQQPEASIVAALAKDDDAAHRAKRDFAERFSFPDAESFNVRYAAGRSDFFTDIPDREEAVAPIVARDPQKVSVDSHRIGFARPSTAHGGGNKRQIENCFVPARGAETGTLVHALFEKIDFLDEKFDAEKFLAANFPDGDAKVRELFLASLAKPEIFNALKRPAPDIVLWREKDFLHRTAEGIVSGTFDRVVLICENTRIVRAEILDYKSDHLTSPEDFLERHAAQLEIYRNALAAMTHLEPDRINCTLLALRLGKAVSVPIPR